MSSPKILEVSLIYNKENQFGLKQDANLIQETLKSCHVRHVDPLEPPVSCDVAIHFEVPIYVYMPWATVNILVINPEWFEEKAWKPYMIHFDALIFKENAAAKRFLVRNPEFTEKTHVIPWCLPESALPDKVQPVSTTQKDGFVWFLAGSRNKRAAAERILPLWKESWPSLRVFSRVPLVLEGGVAKNVSLEIKDLDSENRKKLLAFYPGHICISEAEGFGFTAAEAEANGAWMLLNNLDVYEEDYGRENLIQSGFLKTVLVEKGAARRVDWNQGENIQEQLEILISRFLELDLVARRNQGKAISQERRRKFQEDSWKHFWNQVCSTLETRGSLKPTHLPPILIPDDCPPISIITLMYNRKKFFDLACHNIMISDYPKNKIEWVIVDDTDDPMEGCSDRIVQVGLKAAPLSLVYVPLEKKTPIGQKRNIGIRRAKHDILIMMDDDDHYPETSIRRRVAWLTKFPTKPSAVACTTIACYDLLRGTSAVNTPPWDLPLRQRISEATLCFYRWWWAMKPFPSESEVGEGEGFLEGREQEILELPPQQIIVALSHKHNTSSRRIPASDIKPGCFWGFPKEFLIFLHKLAGVEVEEMKPEKQKGR
jgi:hypothetical protein